MLKVDALPLLQDNYAYLLSASGHAVVVDPSEGEPVLARLRADGLTLDAIWCTHHHGDHVDGVEMLAEAFPSAAVIGSVYDQQHQRIPRQTVAADETGFSWAGYPVRVLDVPGHTLGAVSYVIDGNVFTGDTLFLCGCGRLFEGTAEQMFASFAKLSALPDATRVWCGHEYTAQNLRFCAHVDSSNQAIAQRAAAVRPGARTVPGSIGDEKETNVFVRAKTAAEFAVLRSAKDNF